MTQEEKQTATPKLRFSEFKNENKWTTETLGTFATIISEKVGDRDCVPLSITSGVGLVSQVEKFGRIIAGDSYKNYILIRNNDFAYNKSATKEYPEGFIAHYSGDEPAAVPNSIFTCFRINGNSPDPRYLKYLFLGNFHGRWLRKFIEVGSRAHGSLSVKDDDLLAMPVPLPRGKSSLAEQGKIAECLSTLEELIEAETRKLDALKDHKKALMQRLFPREGETRPRLRFPQFSSESEWQETSLGQVVDFESGATPSKQNPKFWGGSIPWATAKDLRSFFLRDTEDHITEAAIEDGARTVPAGTVLMLTRGMTLFRDIPVCVTCRPMSFNQDIKALRVGGELTEDFLPHLLSANKQRLLKLVAPAGHGTGRLHTDTVRSLRIRYPKEDEQETIANCLNCLKTLIAAQSDRLAALLTQKRGLMQRLLPTPSEFES